MMQDSRPDLPPASKKASSFARRASCLIAVLFLQVFAAPDRVDAAPRLKVSENGRHLVKDDGTPFFYLADSAWELFHRMEPDKAELYMKHRARNGFTVIHASLIAELDAFGTPRKTDAMPLKDDNPETPNRVYFRDIDYLVGRAEDLGLFMGLAPTWGDKWNKRWGLGPEVFTPENAREYGEFLGDRYQERPVIWILGADRNPDTKKHFEIIRAMAEGLRKGSEGKQLIAYLPMDGGNSAKWFHDAKWLDLHMINSGNRAADLANYAPIAENHARKSPKPTLDGGARMEEHPIGWNPENGWFDEYDARQAAYWALLSGACGHAYGHHGAWQMWEADKPPVSFVRTPWIDALSAPGGGQMKHVRALFEARPWHRLVPDQDLIAGNPRRGADHVRAARAEDGSFALIYSPTGRSVTINLEKIKAKKIRAMWFNPREGKAGVLGEYEGEKKRTFEFFSHGRGNDWMLIVEDAAKGLPLPGVTPSKK